MLDEAPHQSTQFIHRQWLRWDLDRFRSRFCCSRWFFDYSSWAVICGHESQQIVTNRLRYVDSDDPRRLVGPYFGKVFLFFVHPLRFWT
ncbi:MAG: hypothetical protein WA824_06040, partial [Candidatus Sulfotelmatobacter sp.]